MNTESLTASPLATDPEIKQIKHSFMAFRNGIIADTLRAAGLPHSIIFGLQLPQLSQIAREVRARIESRYQSLSSDTSNNSNSSNSSDLRLFEIASLLWSDKSVRESRLLAPYLFPHDLIDESRALSLATEVISREEADILCFRLLRYLPFATDLLSGLESLPDIPGNLLPRYTASALRRNLS